MNFFYFILILLGMALRFLPHPPNFTPIGAIALFSGRYIKNRLLAIIIPVLTMLISDYFIGFYSLPIMLTVYLSFGAMTLIGFWLRKNSSAFRIIGASLFGSTLFFIATNAAVWGFTALYPKNPAGLLTSYVMGIPFFKYTLLGDLFYTAILFGTASLANRLIAARQVQGGFLNLIPPKTG